MEIPEFKVRKAVLKDTNQIVILLRELGYPNPRKSVITKLGQDLTDYKRR